MSSVAISGNAVPSSKWVASSLVALTLGLLAYFTDSPVEVAEEVEWVAVAVVTQAVQYLKREFNPPTVYVRD